MIPTLRRNDFQLQAYFYENNWLVNNKIATITGEFVFNKLLHNACCLLKPESIALQAKLQEIKKHIGINIYLFS